MAKYTLDTEFSTLNGPKAKNWVLKIRNMADSAFSGSDNRARLVGSLLIIEQYAHTLRKGLAAIGKCPSSILSKALDLLWRYVDNCTMNADFQDFANNIYACTLAHNADEELTDTQEFFYKEHFSSVELCVIEWEIITWAASLLIELVAIEGGCLDFEEVESYEQISFYNLDDLLGFLTDASMYFTNLGPPDTGRDYAKAQEQVYETPLFQYIAEHIRLGLKTALATSADQYSALRVEYQQRSIIPEEYIPALMKFQQL